ncbi:MAG: hypothetical protein WCI73_10425, partial [Phycisphaerae bacterium]
MTGKQNTFHWSDLENLESRLLLSATVQLPGMHLVDSAVNRFDGQVVYLDFDGVRNVTYRGPVVLEGLTVPAFKAPNAVMSTEDAIKIAIVAAISNTYANSGLQVTTSKPESGTAYSTVYVGGSDSAFSRYGSFSGVAEDVDAGNTHPADNAFVFSDNIAGAGDQYINGVAEVATHEIGHLLGYVHQTADGGDILDAVASRPDPSSAPSIRFLLPLATDSPHHYYFDRNGTAGAVLAWNGAVTDNIY